MLDFFPLKTDICDSNFHTKSVRDNNVAYTLHFYMSRILTLYLGETRSETLIRVIETPNPDAYMFRVQEALFQVER